MSTSEVRAVCGSSARTDLCGGRSAMTVPTAIGRHSREFLPIVLTTPCLDTQVRLVPLSIETRRSSCIWRNEFSLLSRQIRRWLRRCSFHFMSPINPSVPSGSSRMMKIASLIERMSASPKSLAQFASVGWQLWKARVDAERRNQELDQCVHDRTRELENTHRRLREAQVLGTLGTAAVKIIHDLANPLNTISTMVQLLERYLETNTERHLIAEIVQDLKQQDLRVHKLIDELRQFTRPLELNLEPVDRTRHCCKLFTKRACYVMIRIS